MNIDDIKVGRYYGESHDAEFAYYCISVDEWDIEYMLMRKMVDGGYALMNKHPYRTRKLGVSSTMKAEINVKESSYEICVDGYRKRAICYETFDNDMMDMHKDFINMVVTEYMKHSRGHGNPKHVIHCVQNMIRELNSSSYIFNGFRDKVN